VDKFAFKTPFVCGCPEPGRRRCAASPRARHDPLEGGSGHRDIVQAVRHLRETWGTSAGSRSSGKRSSCTRPRRWAPPFELIRMVAKEGKLPVPFFCAGGVATPADASLVMQLGAESVFVGSGIFKSENPAVRARAIVEATTHFRTPKSWCGEREPGGRHVRGGGGLPQGRGTARDPGW